MIYLSDIIMITLKIMKVFKRLFSLLLLSVSIAAGAQSESVVLRMDVGDDFEVGTKNAFTLKMNMMGQEMEMSMEFGGTASAIEAETEGNVAISHVFTDIIIELKADGIVGRYNSRTGENTFPAGTEEITMVAKMFNGIRMNVEYTAQAEFVKVLNPDEVVDHMIAAMDEGEEASEMMREEMRREVLDGSMNDQIGLSAVAYPVDAISVGDTWSSTETTNSGGIPIAMDLNYTVSEIKNGKVFIDVTGGFAEDAANALAGMFGESGFEGEVIIDQATGWVLKNEITMDSGYSSEVEGESSKESEEMTMKMFMHVLSTSEL